MLLGIVLHSASIYKTSASWLIHDTASSSFFDNIIYFIHLFRMPAFFIVSGFFCHMTLTRYGSSRFLRVRLKRIIIPIITVAITLNSLQMYILANHNGDTSATQKLTSTAYWFSEDWVSHLWFLNCLVIYFLVSGLVYALFSRQLIKIMDVLRNNKGILIGGLYLLALPLFSYGIQFAGYRINFRFSGPLGFLNFDEIMQYAGYFIFGIFMGAHKHVIEDFSKFRAWTLAVLLASIYLLFNILDDNNGAAHKIANRYLALLVIWILCTYCFFLFKTYLNNHSKIFLYLSDASYSIYLFHHLFVVAFGLLLIQLNISIYLKFILVMLATTVVTVILHHFLVLKISLLRLLFNGK